MTVRCPGCQTVYRVDPERIPQGGVRTRCSKCATVFVVSGAATTGSTPVSAPAPAPLAPPPAAAAPAAPTTTPAATAPAAPTTTPAAAASPPPTVAVPAPPPAPAAPPAAAPARPAPAASAAAPAPKAAPPAAAAAGARARPVFGAQDPDTRAQRIARALVSDMVVYAGARRDQSLAAGTLKGDFREEILKSWEEYVAQVGQEMAKKSPHFRDALNAILAKGQSIF